LATSYTGVGQIVEAFRSGIGEQIHGSDPLAPERLYQKLFTLTSQRLAHERGWGRETLVRISAAVDIACWGHHRKDGRPAALSFVGWLSRPRALLCHMRLLP
jgi:hypothetical protein